MFTVKRVKPRGNPKSFFPDLEKVIREASRLETLEIKKDLQKTTRNFTTVKPRFRVRRRRNTWQITMVDGESARIWNILNDGAKEHEIRPKNAPALVFATGGFIPKTKVGTVVTRKGKRATTGIQRTQVVQHPGVQARRWSEIIAKRSRRRYVKRLNKMIKQAIVKNAKST